MVSCWSLYVSGTKRLVAESLSDIETSILIEIQSIANILFVTEFMETVPNRTLGVTR